MGKTVQIRLVDDKNCKVKIKSYTIDNQKIKIIFLLKLNL